MTEQDIVSLAGEFSKLSPPHHPEVGLGACLFLLFVSMAGRFPVKEEFGKWVEQTLTYLAGSIHRQGDGPVVIAPGSNKIH